MTKHALCELFTRWRQDIDTPPIPVLVDVDTAVDLIRNTPPQEGIRIAQHSAR